MALSSSPRRRPSDIKRRSTGADTNHSGSGLDYYWSAVAGVGPSSSTSSLAISPSPSGGAGPGGFLSPHSPTSPTGKSPFHLQTRSATDLRSLAASSAPRAGHGEEYLLDSPKSAATDSWANQPLSARSADSNYSIQSNMAGRSVPKRPKDLLLERNSRERPALDSPNSDASAYSSAPSPLVTSLPAAEYAWHYASNSPTGSDAHTLPVERGIMSSESAYSASEHTARYDPVRESFLSGASGASTAMQSDELHFDPNETPVAPGNRLERVLNPPSAFTYHPPARTAEPTSAAMAANTRAGGARERRESPVKKSSPPTRHSFDDGARESSRADGSRKTSGSEAKGSGKAPSSAPPWQTEFGGRGAPKTDEEGDDEDTLKAAARGRGRAGFPSSTALEPAVSAREKPRRGSDNGPAPQGSSMLSPARPEPVRRSSTPGLAPEGPSPTLPPRSALRGPPSPAPSKLQLSTVPTPPRIDSPPPSPPPPKSHKLPTITHTPVSPNAPRAPRSAQPTVDVPHRSAARDNSVDKMSPNSATSIAELTGMLEGAIDEIGLINSQETPPPTVFPPREKPVLTASSPRTTDGSPKRPVDFSSDAATTHAVEAPPPRPTAQMQHTASSPSLSLASTTVTPTAQPWPQAMMSGNIRNLKFAGDRAKGYAKAINELSRSESGLKEWCAAASSSTHRAPAHTLSKQFAHATHLGRGDPSTSSLPSYFGGGAGSVGHPRNVSSSSEFPLREDSYSAREIVQRTIDPTDQPTALPANLPYPQLQRGAVVGGGMKNSPSMASMASVASHKKGGFFSAMRKGKKDSVSSLGPPNPGSGIGVGGAGGIARSMTPVGAEGRAGNLPAPVGPRDPYRGSFTPPPGASFGELRGANGGAGTRASLDTGLSKVYDGQSRGSFDSIQSARTAKSTLGHGGAGSKSPSPLVGDHTPHVPSGYATPREDDGGLGYMTDVLPHVERGVLRGYLGRYGDSMRAIGAYLEDEKRGTVAKLH